MKTKTKTFDTVAFFRSVKEKLAKKMEGMSLAQKKEFMLQVREGKIKILEEPNYANKSVAK